MNRDRRWNRSRRTGVVDGHRLYEPRRGDAAPDTRSLPGPGSPRTRRLTVPTTTSSLPCRALIIAALTTAAGLVTSAPSGAIPIDPPTCFGQTITRFAVPGTPTNGTSARDVILGTNYRDVIAGLGGDDYICGMGGDDVIYGDGQATFGHDYVDGGLGYNTLHGGAGNDHVYANIANVAGSNRSDLYGDSGNDHVVGGAGIDILEDGNGTDYVSGNGGPTYFEAPATAERSVPTSSRGAPATTGCTRSMTRSTSRARSSRIGPAARRSSSAATATTCCSALTRPTSSTGARATTRSPAMGESISRTVGQGRTRFGARLLRPHARR